MRKMILLALAAVVGLCLSLPASAAMDQGDKKFEVSGEVRVRADYSDNATDISDSAPPLGADDSGLIWPWRARVGIHGSFSRNVAAHIEFQSFGYAGDGSNGVFPLSGSSNADLGFAGGSVDSANTHLYQGWLELGDIGGTTFDLRLGRQELVYGNEMLLGDNDFYNGTVHDGAKAGWQYKKWSLDTFYTKFFESSAIPGGSSIFPTFQPSDDMTLAGAYATFKGPKKIGFDAYLLQFNDGTSGAQIDDTTIGGRVYNKGTSNWAWWAELALQSGEFDDGVTTTDLKARGFEGELAYTFRKVKVAPRVHLRYSSFTGSDDDPDEFEGFIAPFQDTHGRYGLFDLFIPTNLDVIEVGVSWNGKEDRHVFGANVLSFTSNEETVNNANIDEDDLGSEIDLFYNYAYSKNVMIQAAIASFSPGDVFTATLNPGGTADSSNEINGNGVDDDSALRVYANTRLRW